VLRASSKYNHSSTWEKIIHRLKAQNHESCLWIRLVKLLTCWIESILENFMTGMQEKLAFKSSMVAEKLQRIRLAIRYTIRDKDDYTKVKRIIGLIEDWGHGLGKDISIQKKECVLAVRQMLHKLEDPNEFLENESVCPHFNFCSNLTLIYRSKINYLKHFIMSQMGI